MKYLAAALFPTTLVRTYEFQKGLPPRMLVNGDRAPFIHDFTDFQNMVLLVLSFLRQVDNSPGKSLVSNNSKKINISLNKGRNNDFIRYKDHHNTYCQRKSWFSMGIHSTIFGPSKGGLSFLMHLYWSMKPPDNLQSPFHPQTQIQSFAAVTLFLFKKSYTLLLNLAKKKKNLKRKRAMINGKN